MSNHQEHPIHRTPATFCPNCKEPHDGAGLSPAEKANAVPPRPGDFAVCFYCTAWAVYTDDLQLREFTDADREGLTPDEFYALKRTEEMIRKHNRERRGQL